MGMIELFIRNDAKSATYTDEARDLDSELAVQFTKIAEQLNNPRDLHALVSGAASSAVAIVCLNRAMLYRKTQHEKQKASQ